MTEETPFVGQKLYVPTIKSKTLPTYVSKGMATVSKVYTHLSVPFIGFEELPDQKMNYPWLLRQQEDLEKTCKGIKAEIKKNEI